MYIRAFYLVMVTCESIVQVAAQTGDNLNDVLREIYDNRHYNKNTRPLQDQGFPLFVSVEYYLNSVIDFDEKTENLKVAGYLSVTWRDEYFAWSKEAFNNTEGLFVPQDEIWKPDITLANSFKSFTGLGSSFLLIHVNHLGDVTWSPFQVLESTCSVTITYLSFDIQTCHLKFTAWSYTNTDVILSVGEKGIVLDEYVPNASWEIIETSTVEEGLLFFEAAIVFEIRLKRKARFYVINVVIPIIFLSILNVFSFVLPVVSGERAGYSITVFLSLAVFLTIVSDQLPRNSDITSLMAVYLMSVTCLSTAIVIVCIIQLRMQSWQDSQKPVTKFYRNFVTIRNWFRCCKQRNPSVFPSDQIPSDNDVTNNDMAATTGARQIDDAMNEQRDVTWLDVVNAMDFIFFFFSLLYTLICTLVIGIIAVNVPK